MDEDLIKMAIKEYIKGHLTIEISKEVTYRSVGTEVEVSLWLDGVKVSYDWVTIAEGSD